MKIYKTVDLKRKNDSPRFPNICIECGKICENETIEIKNFVGGPFGNWKTILKKSETIFVPAHKKCGEIIKRKEFICECICFILSVIPPGIYFIINRQLDKTIAWVLLLSAVISAMLIDLIYYKRPIVFITYDDRISFKIRNHSFANEFEIANKEDIYKRNLLGNFGQLTK